MHVQKAATGKTVASLAIVAVIVALAFGAYGLTRPPTVETSYVTNTTTYTTTVYKNMEMVGTCTAVSYIIPDTEEAFLANVTVISGTSTTYYLSTTAVVTAGETTLGTTAYITSTYANSTAAYAVTSTSQNLDVIPSDGWTVTACTLVPQG